ncbi:MAG: tetratricopeptide repeat protein [Helicobacteraceae bacterium]|nr:tetratricopeptide repeat protein [Helicobacteraceae bacterium]
MKYLLQLLRTSLLLGLLFVNPLIASEKPEESPLSKPLIERYILDELKSLRVEQEQFKASVQTTVAKGQMEQTDRAARYITDTIGNVFYLIAGATSLLIFAGWNSLRDIRKKTEQIIEERVHDITERYNESFEILQQKLTEQSEKILVNQKKIYDTQLIHSLWMRANLETNLQSKIEIYDEILEVNAMDAEVYAYKADAVLDLDEFEWALNLSNKALEIDSEYGYAFWQRACANAQLGNKSEAIIDLKTALGISPNLKEEIALELSFEPLNELDEFKSLMT